MSDAYRDFAVAVTLIRRRLRTRFTESLPESGPTATEWIALLWLNEMGGTVGQGNLAERLETDPATMTRMIDSMVRQGWVERQFGQFDRRVKVICLTDAARPLIEEGEAIGRRIRREVFGSVPKAEFDLCLKVLGTLADKLA